MNMDNLIEIIGKGFLTLIIISIYIGIAIGSMNQISKHDSIALSITWALVLVIISTLVLGTLVVLL